MIIRPVDCLKRIEYCSQGPINIGSNLVNSRFWDRSSQIEVDPGSQSQGNDIVRQLFLSNLGSFTRALAKHPSSSDEKVSAQLQSLNRLIEQCSNDPSVKIDDDLRDLLQELVSYISELELVTISLEQIAPQYGGEEGAHLESLSNEALRYLQELDPDSLPRQFAEPRINKVVDTLNSLNKQNSRVTIKPNNFHIIWIKSNAGINETPIPSHSYAYKIFTSEDALREAEELIHSAFLRAVKFLNVDESSISGIVIHGYSDADPERNSKLGIRLNHRNIEYLLKAVVNDDLEMKDLAFRDLESLFINEITYELKYQKSSNQLFELGKDIAANATQILQGGIVNPVKLEDLNLSINSRTYVPNTYYQGLEHSLRLVYRELLESGFTEDDIRDYRPRSLTNLIAQIKSEPEGQKIISEIVSRILNARDEELIRLAKEINHPKVTLLEKQDNGVEIFVDPILTTPAMVVKIADLDKRIAARRIYLSPEVSSIMQMEGHQMYERAINAFRTAQDIANQTIVIPVNNQGAKMSVEEYVAARRIREIRESPSRTSFPSYYEFTPDFVQNNREALKFLGVKGVLEFDSANLLTQDYLINTNHTYGILIERTNVS